MVPQHSLGPTLTTMLINERKRTDVTPTHDPMHTHHLFCSMASIVDLISQGRLPPPAACVRASYLCRQEHLYGNAARCGLHGRSNWLRQSVRQNGPPQRRVQSRIDCNYGCTTIQEHDHLGVMKTCNPRKEQTNRYIVFDRVHVCDEAEAGSNSSCAVCCVPANSRSSLSWFSKNFFAAPAFGPACQGTGSPGRSGSNS